MIGAAAEGVLEFVTVYAVTFTEIIAHNAIEGEEDHETIDGEKDHKD